MDSKVSTKTRKSAVIREMTKEDYDFIRMINDAVHDVEITKKDFSRLFRNNNNLYSFVAVLKNRVIGYMILEVTPDSIELVNISVHPSIQRQRIGTQLINWLINKLCSISKVPKFVEATVRESNLETHLFLKSLNFTAVKVLRRIFPDTHEDGYLFKNEIIPKQCSLKQD